MIPEAGTRKQFKQVLFETFPAPKKGELWYLKVPLIPHNGVYNYMPLRIKHIVDGDVLYGLTSEALANTGEISVKHFVQMSVLGDITSSVQ
jgi:hypothetical protein